MTDALTDRANSRLRITAKLEQFEAAFDFQSLTQSKIDGAMRFLATLDIFPKEKSDFVVLQDLDQAIKIIEKNHKLYSAYWTDLSQDLLAAKHLLALETIQPRARTIKSKIEDNYLLALHLHANVAIDRFLEIAAELEHHTNTQEFASYLREKLLVCHRALRRDDFNEVKSFHSACDQVRLFIVSVCGINFLRIDPLKASSAPDHADKNSRQIADYLINKPLRTFDKALVHGVSRRFLLDQNRQTNFRKFQRILAGIQTRKIRGRQISLLVRPPDFEAFKSRTERHIQELEFNCDPDCDEIPDYDSEWMAELTQEIDLDPEIELTTETEAEIAGGLFTTDESTGIRSHRCPLQLLMRDRNEVPGTVNANALTLAELVLLDSELRKAWEDSKKTDDRSLRLGYAITLLELARTTGAKLEQICSLKVHPTKSQPERPVSTTTIWLREADKSNTLEAFIFLPAQNQDAKASLPRGTALQHAAANPGFRFMPSETVVNLLPSMTYDSFQIGLASLKLFGTELFGGWLGRRRIIGQIDKCINSLHHEHNSESLIHWISLKSHPDPIGHRYRCFWFNWVCQSLHETQTNYAEFANQTPPEKLSPLEDGYPWGTQKSLQIGMLREKISQIADEVATLKPNRVYQAKKLYPKCVSALAVCTQLAIAGRYRAPHKFATLSFDRMIWSLDKYIIGQATERTAHQLTIGKRLELELKKLARSYPKIHQAYITEPDLKDFRLNILEFLELEDQDPKYHLDLFRHTAATILAKTEAIHPYEASAFLGHRHGCRNWDAPYRIRPIEESMAEIAEAINDGLLGTQLK